MRDLRVIIPSEKRNTLVSNAGLEFVDLMESSINTTINKRSVSGKHGTNKSGSEVGDTNLTLIVRFSSPNTSEYFKAEKRLMSLFSREDSFTIAPMYNDDAQYEFVKIGQRQPSNSKLEENYYYDVMLDGDFKMTRNGHFAEVEIPLITSTSPYRYASEKAIDLSKPTSTGAGRFEYTFNNEGNIDQDSRRFELNLELSGVSGSSLTVTSKGVFKYTGAISTSDKLVFNGYSTKIGTRNVTNLTNYGTVDIARGFNRVVITGVSGTPKGKLVFKEYIR